MPVKQSFNKPLGSDDDCSFVGQKGKSMALLEDKGFNIVC